VVQVRIIPCLLVSAGALVKTRRFSDAKYIGDPLNTARIFNELEVDELMVLDIRATVENRLPDIDLISSLANECFMPLTYGGGIRDAATAARIFEIGVEKVVLNSAPFELPELIPELAEKFGSQAIVGAIDFRKGLIGGVTACSRSGRVRSKYDPAAWAAELVRQGAGELVVTAIDREGTWKGFDVQTTRRIADAVNVPMIAHGGAASVADIAAAVHDGHASAVAIGNMVVYQGPGRGVLVNFPDRAELDQVLASPSGQTA
jgi:cyclase